MLMNLNMFFIMMFITMLLMFMNFLLSMKINLNRKKNMPFECGFNPISSSRLPFSIHFFLITLLFLIFDIEIILIIPSIFMIKFNSIYLSLILLSFIILMTLSLIYEWLMSLLNWIF